mmetsp:Transcript_15269/g.29043  ORF Transcript_15269/g.29043 Transcript_15269/m.29043 type:complete len:109 (-) Transcript_15269:44-370(-)
MNPCKDVGLYGADVHEFYRHDKKTMVLPPHAFDVAKRAHRQMLHPLDEPKNQSVLMSGESGAGKTEATKIFLRHFTKQSEIVSPAAKAASMRIFLGVSLHCERMRNFL